MAVPEQRGEATVEVAAVVGVVPEVDVVGVSGMEV